jgi:predicted ATPase with chaperone activity
MLYDPTGRQTRRAITKLRMSARAFCRILNGHRTTVDLVQSERPFQRKGFLLDTRWQEPQSWRH